MITAIDSSVLWAILKQEPGHDKWLEALFGAASDGPLILCPVVFAELAPSTADAPELSGFLARLTISYSPIIEAAAHLAGQTFKQKLTSTPPK